MTYIVVVHLRARRYHVELDDVHLVARLHVRMDAELDAAGRLARHNGDAHRAGTVARMLVQAVLLVHAAAVVRVAEVQPYRAYRQRPDFKRHE